METRGERASEEQRPDTTWLWQIVELNLAGIYRTSWDGRILYCNEALARMLGYKSPSELYERRATDLYPSTRARERFLDKLRSEGALTNFELVLRRKDGHRITVLENVSLVRTPGGEETIQGTMVDITALKSVESQLRRSEEQQRSLAERLRDLAQHLEKVREDERSRIARELHDELGQALTALKLDLHWLAEQGPRDEASETRFRSMLEMLERTIASVRRLCSDLRPAVLDDLGLGAAISWLAQDVERRAGIRCRVSLPTSFPELPKPIATAAFRILQESLTNVVRHADAQQVVIAVVIRKGHLVMEVRDDGRGFAPSNRRGREAFGLAGMQERALQLGGRLRVLSHLGAGTTVRLTLPLGQEHKRDEP